jgi:hypothetical protein
MYDKDVQEWNPGMHITMGSLISALSDKEFLKRYFQKFLKTRKK